MRAETVPAHVLASYCTRPEEATISPLGEGNINDTFLVQTGEQHIVVQRINGQVFPDPEILIQNLHHLTAHLQTKTSPNEQHWQDTVLVPTVHGEFSVEDKKGSLWRALSYIENSCTLSQITTSFQAEQTGSALGYFHNRLIGLDIQEMKSPLPGFHQISNYLQQYDQISNSSRSADIDFCINIIERERAGITVLEEAFLQGTIQERIVHGDPKVANILFDRDSHQALSIIDLDTIGPGLLQHDIGDCLRSACNHGSATGKPEAAVFTIDLCRGILKGYFRETKNLLTHMDREYIYDGVKTITFELGLRFFSDFLAGGNYFKCSHPEETLHKAMGQFSLLQSIIAQEKNIRKLSRSL